MANFYPFLAYVVVTTFTPGPNNIMAMTNAVRYGYRKTVGFVMGMTVGFFIIMLASGMLNFVLISFLPQLKFWLSILGAIYMVYLAVHIFLSKPVEDDPTQDSLNTFKAGFTLQFLNVKVILYGITVYSNFIVPSYHTPYAVAWFAPILTLVVLASNSSWAVGGDVFRRFLKKYNRWFNLAMGVLLIYVAVASLLE
jgi:cysteine/O-acetylserine efflux protein